MSIELIGVIVSNVVAVASAVIAVYSQRRSTRLEAELERLRIAEQRRFELDQTVDKFRKPLAQAAYDLQSRIYNILTKKQVETYVVQGSERSRSYLIDNSTFLIGQYFAWTEIIRKEIQFLDLGEGEKTRTLAALQDRIHFIWQSDQPEFTTALRVFAGEQRAIGESLIVEGPRGPECIGYGRFLRTLKVKKNALVEAVRQDISELPDILERATPRLIAIQNALIDLLDHLDPHYLRFPARNRQKVQPAKEIAGDTLDA